VVIFPPLIFIFAPISVLYYTQRLKTEWYAIFVVESIVLYRVYSKLAFYLHGNARDHEIDFLCSSSLEAIPLIYPLCFLAEDFVRFALEISPELKVKDGVGKYILRKSFEDLIPPEIVWRRKEPIEYGSGSTKLHEIINGMVTDEEFKSATREVDIKFINKEHFFYYRIYNEVVGEIPKARADETSCPCCGAGMGTYHCRTCGFSRPLL
jgi:hypothetical protein